MKIMKRSVALLLAIAMLLSFAVVAGAADKTTTISVDSVTMKPGETKTIPVKVTSTIASQIHAVSFKLASENPAVTIKYVNPLAGVIATGATYSDNTGSMAWNNLAASLGDYIDQGVENFINIKVTVSADAAVGSYPIKVLKADDSPLIATIDENDEL